MRPYLSEEIYKLPSLNGWTKVINEMDLTLKSRQDIHWARKIWHCGGVLAIAYVYHHLPIAWAISLAWCVAAVFVVLDFWRLRSQTVNSGLMLFFKPFMREEERRNLAGTSYLLLGSALIITFCPPAVTELTLILLAVADPLASVVGLRFGQDKLFGHKSLQGTMAAFFSCMFLSAFYLWQNNLMVDRLLFISILCGLIGAIAELVPIFKLDDNFTFPVITAASLWVLFSAFGGLHV